MSDKSVKSSRVIVPHGVKWHGRLTAALIYAFIRIIGGTMRIRLENGADLVEEGTKTPVIFCLWHNRLALALTLYRKFILRRDANRGLAAMVSASKDGGLLARVLEHFGAQPVRGSSSRRGPQALLELTTWAERGFDIAITPDGPRGPCYVVQEGIIGLAQLTGLPILPVTFHLNWKLRLRSWDRFQIPIPLGICRVSVGRRVFVPKDASDFERAKLRSELENQLRVLTKD